MSHIGQNEIRTQWTKKIQYTIICAKNTSHNKKKEGKRTQYVQKWAQMDTDKVCPLLSLNILKYEDMDNIVLDQPIKKG